MQDHQPIDLNLSCVMIGPNGKIEGVISQENIDGHYSSIKHSGDDKTGDSKGNDETDNEFITIKLSKIEQEGDKMSSIKVKNAYIGDIMIHNCDPEIFQKALSVMSNYMKNKSSYVSDLMHFVFS